MSTSYNRAQVRTEVREVINEAVADMVDDTTMNDMIKQEIRSLPRKGIYLQQLYTAPTVAYQYDYTLPSNTLEVEQVDRNWGTDALPFWDEEKGWKMEAGALYLGTRPLIVWTMRIHIRAAFTDFSDDTTISDIPDEKMEVVILGTAVRCYRHIIGYLKNAKNWDAIAKPDGISMGMIQRWYQELKVDYKEAINKNRFYPQPREIDLVN